MKRWMFGFLAVILLGSVLIPLSAQAEMQKLAIDTGKSEVRWLGRKVAGSHNGTVKLKEGEVLLEDGKIVGGNFTIDMASIENQDIESEKWRSKLENHLKSDDFFNISTYPVSSFKITEVVDKREGESGSVEIKGMLTVKGISLPVVIPAEVTKDGEVYTATGKANLDRTKWDIRYNSGKFFDPANLGDKLIYDDIGVEVLVVARPGEV